MGLVVLFEAITTFISCGKPLKKSCKLGVKYVSKTLRSNPTMEKGMVSKPFKLI